MENVSRSINRSHSSASISKKVFRASGFASKSLYNDVYGGIPKFGTLAFSPSVEDYAEIFGTFRPFRASSIPILDLPFVHEADATFDFQSSCFNYSDVFRASSSFNFAASYEDLFKMSEPGADDHSSDDIWTPAQSELSDVSEAHIYNTNADKYWRGDLHQSINTIPSGCDAQKDKLQKEQFSNLQTHVSHLQSLSGMLIVDNQTHVLQNKYEHPCMSKSTEDSNTCSNVIRHADAPKFFRKTHSLPINSGEGNGKTIGNSNHATYFKRKPQDVYEQSLDIGDSVVPPQSRLLPELLDTGNQETCDRSSHHIISTSHIPQTIPVYDSPALYDTEVNASLFAATSAASIKEVMKKAQTKLRNAKKIMEKRKEVLQNCLRLELDTNVKNVEEEKPEFHTHSNFSDKNMADTCGIKGNELRSFPRQEEKISMISLGNDISEKVRYFNLPELSTPKNPGQRSSIKKNQCCQTVDESAEERNLCEHEGENSLGNALEKSDNEEIKNEKYWTVNKCKYGTKIFVEKEKMSEENDSRWLNENITTIQMEEGNHAFVFSKVADREIVKNDSVSSEEQKFKTLFELECCREEEKLANETWTRKNNDFELKIEKIKSAVNESFKGTLSRPLKTQEDYEIDKSIKIPQNSRGKQIPIMENLDNKRQMVGFKTGKNNKLQENGDSKSMYLHNLVKLKEYDRIADAMNNEDGCHVHEGNEVDKIMEEAWVIAVKNEELENTEGVFELGENQEKCKRYMWHDAKVGWHQHQPFCAKVQHQKNGVHFLQSYENHVCLDLKCDKIIDETSHEEAGGNVIEISVTKKHEQDIDVPGVLLGISDDDEGNTSRNCRQTLSTELVLGEDSRALDISRTDIFVHESKKNLDDVLHVVSGGRNVSASEENGEVVGEAIKSKLFLNMEITKGIQNQRIMGIRKMVQNVNNTYGNMQINCNSQNIAVDNNIGSMNRIKEMGSDHRREAEDMERETEHKKDMIDVEITCETKEKSQQDIDSASGAYMHTDSIKFGEKVEKLSPGEKQYTVEFQSVEGVTTEARGRDGELKIFDKSTCKAQERAKITVRSGDDESKSDGIISTTSFNLQGRGYSSGFRNQNASNYTAVGSESFRRHQARLERHQRTIDRVGKALEEKNRRDLIVQQEKAERCRLAESLDADVKRWSNGKEGNLRALLSTLQYILGGESGWKAVTLTEVITSVGVKKAYRKATLCLHPDKLQQRGATIHDKYISEKVFDLLKEAWNRFNSEER